jgi:hypothetical protein
MKRLLRSLLLLGTLMLATSVAHAHASSTSFLSITAHDTLLTGRWDIALRDLDYVVGLDTNGDGRVTWGEVRARTAQIDDYALGRLSVRSAHVPCSFKAPDILIDRHTDGAYAVLSLEGRCERGGGALQVTYGLLFDADTTHRGLLRLERSGQTHTAVFAPESRVQRFTGGSSLFETFAEFVTSGVHHILGGYDHLLFLFSLLLPAVVLRVRSQWSPVSAARPVLVDVLRTVTAFTVAHSITFMLAAYGTVRLPSRFVESAIAASVVVAALNNVVGVVERRRWIAAFCFGLVHGFGFASVLTGLELPSGAARALPLLGFNLGVELGQLAVVALVLPLLFCLRHTVFYRRAMLVGGSSVIALVGMLWFVERAFLWPVAG